MLWQLVEGLALVLAGFLLGIRIGITQVQGQHPVERGRQGSFHTLGYRFIHIDSIGGVGTELVGAISADLDRTGDAGNLVFKVVMENRDIGLKVPAGVEVQPQLLVHGRFRLQIRVTIDIATAAHLSPIRSNLSQRGRPEAGGDTAFQGPAGAEPPHAIKTRAEVATKVIIVIHPCPGGKCEGIREHPFVFRKQCVLGGINSGTVGNPVGGLVGERFLDKVRTQCQSVIPQRHHQ